MESKAYTAFKAYVEQDKVSRAVQHFAGNWNELYPWEQDTCAKWLKCHREHGGYLTRKAWEQVVNCLSANARQCQDLMEPLNAIPPMPLPFPSGKTHCLCATTEGHVRDIQVFNTISSSKPHQSVLDPIGRALFRAIEKVFRLTLIWNPLKYDYRIQSSQGKEDISVTGSSMGLSLALSLCSHVIGEPIPQDLAASATVTAHGRLGSVEGLAQKVAAVQEERDYVKRVLISADQKGLPVSRLELITVKGIEEALCIVWPNVKITAPVAPIDVERELQDIERLYRDYIVPTCLDNATRLIGHLNSRQCFMIKQEKLRALFTCYWLRGSCRLHLGHPVLAMKDLDRSIDIHRRNEGVIKEQDFQSMRITIGVAMTDLFLYEEAEQFYRDLDQKINVNRHERGKNLSSLSQTLMAMGRYEEAEFLQKQAIELVDDGDRPRNLYYLARVYTAWGKYDAARQALKESRKLYGRQPVPNTSYPPFMDFVEVELHCRWAAILECRKERKPHWDIVHRIAEQHLQKSSWVSALITRFSGLVFLQQNCEETGLERLEWATRFFEDQKEPIMKVLGAAVLAERAIHLLTKGNDADALADLRIIARLLSRQKQIKAFFAKEIGSAMICCSSAKRKHLDRQEIARVLQSICKKIPY